MIDRHTLLRADRPHPGSFRSLCFMAAVVITCPALLGAQRVTGPWDDATIAPRGVLRVGITPRWEQWKERLDADGNRVPLGASVSPDSLGATLPFVAGMAPALGLLSGLPSPPLSFGTLRTRVDVTQVTTHISLDYGLTSRVGLQALIPYVKNRVHVLPILNAGGVGATIGFNPAHSFLGARQQNTLVVTSLTTAASTLTSELARCANSTDASCSAINADRAGAAALVQLAGQISGAFASVYGTTTATGALYAPVAGSVLATAIDARLTSLNTQFRTFLGAPTSGEWIGARPVGAVPGGAADLDALLGGEASGILARPLGDYEHSHVGDIEVGAKLLLLDTFGPPATAPLPRRGAMRLAVAGVYRLGTGQLDLPNDFTDVGTGDRQTDIELRGFADLAVGRRLWVSSVLRLAFQSADDIVRRVPDAAGDVFPEAAREIDVRRDLGEVMEFEIAPRYVPNDEFALSGLYRFRTKTADSYSSLLDAPVTGADGTALSFNAEDLGLHTEQKEHMLGFSVTYSTVRANALRRARWPLEISYIHTQVLSGSGIPRMQMNGIGFRLYR